jgi:hypothetical protein
VSFITTGDNKSPSLTKNDAKSRLKEIKRLLPAIRIPGLLSGSSPAQVEVAVSAAIRILERGLQPAPSGSDAEAA